MTRARPRPPPAATTREAQRPRAGGPRCAHWRNGRRVLFREPCRARPATSTKNTRHTTAGNERAQRRRRSRTSAPGSPIPTRPRRRRALGLGLVGAGWRATVRAFGERQGLLWRMVAARWGGEELMRDMRSLIRRRAGVSTDDLRRFCRTRKTRSAALTRACVGLDDGLGRVGRWPEWIGWRAHAPSTKRNTPN